MGKRMLWSDARWSSLIGFLVYRVWDDSSRLIYVGSTTIRLSKRLQQHEIRSVWTANAVIVEVEEYDTKKEMKEAEQYWISTRIPAHNRMNSVAEWSEDDLRRLEEIAGYGATKRVKFIIS